MERFLLWLDELDDCLAMWCHSPGRIRRGSLRAGLGFALALLLIDAVSRSAALANALIGLAAASVLIWTAAAAAELVTRRAARRRLEMG